MVKLYKKMTEGGGGGSHLEPPHAPKCHQSAFFLRLCFVKTRFENEFTMQSCFCFIIVTVAVIIVVVAVIVIIAAVTRGNF